MWVNLEKLNAAFREKAPALYGNGSPRIDITTGEQVAEFVIVVLNDGSGRICRETKDAYSNDAVPVVDIGGFLSRRWTDEMRKEALERTLAALNEFAPGCAYAGEAGDEPPSATVEPLLGPAGRRIVLEDEPCPTTA